MNATSTILIVTGDPVERETLASLLADQGYGLTFAADGPEALAQIGERNPDAVILEASADGFDLCRKLRSDPHLSDVPVLMAVAAGDQETLVQVLEAGADDWISKPFEYTELLPRLRACARLRSHLRQSWDQLRGQQAEIERHIAEVTTLNKLSQVITSILDLHEILAIIVDHAHWLLDAAAASVILYDRERDELWFGAASGEGAEFVQNRRLETGKGIVNWVIQHGEPLLVADASKDPRFFGDWDQQLGFTIESILCVPLRARDQTIGAIEAINKAGGPFDHKDLTLLTSMAGSAAIAIENARLYEQAQQEIAERKRAEAELRRVNQALEEIVAERTRELQAERDRTQAILEAVGEAVIVTDLQGRIQYLNPAAMELTGYTVEEAMGRSPSLWQAGEQPGEPGFQGPMSLDAAQARSVEVVSRRKDGSLYDSVMTVAPLLDSRAGDKPIGYVSVQRDITPIKEAERLKDEFVSNVSHELRTPLSVIALVSGNLDVLYERLSDEKRQRMIRDIRQHAQVLDDLVGDVLEISRIESGRISMERGEVELVQLAREEIEKQLPLAHRKSQTLQVAGVEQLHVRGNVDQLRQVVRNLLNNAIKYTPEDGKITCECAVLTGETWEATWPGSNELSAGQWAALRVSDTGIGISQEDLPQVFERFYRVKTQGKIPGTGLGLSITKELVESHGGHIAAASTLGVGTVFAIYLPLREERYGYPGNDPRRG
jgi:PAS domain S-box-containing protein